MPLPTCACNNGQPISTQLANIYCALLEVIAGGGGGDFVTLAGIQTLTNKTLTAPRIDEILDVNGVEILGFEATVGAVNHMEIYNTVTGSPPFIEVDGPDADIGFQITTKGNGAINLSAPLVETSLALNVGSDLGVAGNAGIGGNLTAGTALISGNLQFATVGVGADAPAADGTYALPASITIANGVITAIS